VALGVDLVHAAPAGGGTRRRPAARGPLSDAIPQGVSWSRALVTSSRLETPPATGNEEEPPVPLGRLLFDGAIS